MMRALTVPLSGILALATLIVAPATAQHSQVSAVAANPNDHREVWVTNRDNNSVSVIDTTTGSTTAEIAVGIKPRSLAFNDDGSLLFVANQRGNVPHDVHFVTPFQGTEIRGTVSVVDVVSQQVIQTINADQVGVEPYGVALAPNGKFFAVTAFRSGWISFFDATNFARVAQVQFRSNMNFIPAGETIADYDENQDSIADTADPRGFVIRSDSQRIFVTHNKSPYVSVVDLTLDPVSGLPTSAGVTSKINTDQYGLDPLYNPIPVRVQRSAGFPRFLEDIALSPDGTQALVPHLLHNVNHDVNHDFGPDFLGDFANRVYPALTRIDAQNLSYNQAGDTSLRLHHELADDPRPAQYSPLGEPGVNGSDVVTLGGVGDPILGTSLQFVIDGLQPNQQAQIWLGRESHTFIPGLGTLYNKGRIKQNVTGTTHSINLPNSPVLDGMKIVAQVHVINTLTGARDAISNGLSCILRPAGSELGTNAMGYRAGHPTRVLYNPAGDRALMLNRGSEDVFLFDIQGNDMQLRSVFPPRIGFTERAPLDETTPMGDVPMGITMVPDPLTQNDDALVYIINEGTRTLSVLRVDWTTNVISKELDQVKTLLGQDIFDASVRLGFEIFEDASRAQTTHNFNNSCASCHFEGGEDGNVWQRPAGPRSTMPVYGGTLATGMMLWKGVRLNMGETGPMFGGENGGHGIFTDAEQQGLVDYHETIPVPLNPNMDLVTGGLTQQAALGEDLFFGTNDTGLNPNMRSAGCSECHPRTELGSTNVRGFTADFIDPILSSGENLESFDPLCLPLFENILALNLRNINSACNVDVDNDGKPDRDRNADRYPDFETYDVMNVDDEDPFKRDDPNSYPCPLDLSNPQGELREFDRDAKKFSIPTKLGVFSSGPYMHDHSIYSLRTLLDPAAQAVDPVYGSPGRNIGDPDYVGLFKFFNEFHDIRGHEDRVANSSKVQVNLQSTNVQADIEAILAFIESL